MKSSKVKIREYIEFSGVEEYFTPEMELAMVEEYISICSGYTEPVKEIYRRAVQYIQYKEKYTFHYKNGKEFFPMITDFLQNPVEGEIYSAVMQYLLYKTSLDELNADMVTAAYFENGGKE